MVSNMQKDNSKTDSDAEEKRTRTRAPYRLVNLYRDLVRRN